MRVLPYPVASIVEHKTTSGFCTLSYEYLVHNISLNGDEPMYSILGHKELGSDGYGTAWIEHKYLTLISQPSIKSWKWLHQAKAKEGVT